jgi:hypothetical protein
MQTINGPKKGKPIKAKQKIWIDLNAGIRVTVQSKVVPVCFTPEQLALLQKWLA